MMGILRRRPHMEISLVSDEPCLECGDYALSAGDAARRGQVLACTAGRMRNAAKLAEELNLSPKERTGAQIVLAAYDRWGEEYCTHIEGPIATAVIDVPEDLLILTRDRMGERRLFYALENATAAFADHPDALLEAGVVRPVIDAKGLNELFALGPARTPGTTPWRDMFALEPGCALIVRGEAARITRYFQLEAAEHADDFAATVRTVREMLERAVDEIAPLHPGVMLSGGIDSTLLTAMMRKRSDSVRTFSVDYEDNARYFRGNGFQIERDEPYINLAVERIGTQHRRVVLSQAQLAGALGEALDARGFPGMADVDSSLLLFARGIAPHARRVISGECGDEVFGGYPWFRDARSLREDAFPWSGSLELRESILKRRVRDKLRPRRYVRQTLHDAVERVEHLQGEDAAARCLRTMQHLCFAFFMSNLQERAAAMCARAGVEVFTPLCDERLVQYVYNVPWEMKFHDGREKGLLREAVRDLLPQTLLYRKKSPYPKTCHPEYARLAAQLTLAMLEDRRNPLLAFVDPDALQRLAGSQMSPGEAPWYGQLMAGPQMLAYLWQVNEWMRARKAEVSL